jgi:hypothetical protein
LRGPAAVGSAFVITSVVTTRPVALWSSAKAAPVIARAYPAARRKWRSHGLELLLLLIGEDGHQLALYFFFQLGDLFSLVARQVKLTFNWRWNQWPAAARLPGADLASGSLTIIGRALALGRARWLLVIVARPLIIVGRRRRLPIVPASLRRLAVAGIYAGRRFAAHPADHRPGKKGQPESQGQPGHRQFSNFATLHGLTPCQSCRRAHARCARFPRGVMESTGRHLKA